ncbi:MAG: BolA family transcriptional regulator [Methylococcales symbiont of Hymedesmia sp. n. MRB-2018]|nr:MAG: BolA family transcriptional regulator [Methylococcales symbiont of Hymedesmia sp. n. MRB-2018]
MIADLIKQQLTTALKPDSIELIDDSAAHAGHAGAKGGGHYNVTIVAQIFDGKSLLQRHQLIYQALSELMKKDIHALGINALTPSENT